MSVDSDGLRLLGVLAGLGLYFVSVLVLFVAGFSFYSVTAAMFLALILLLIGAPIMYFRLRKRGPQLIERLAAFAAGMALCLITSCVQALIYTPHSVFPWIVG